MTAFRDLAAAERIKRVRAAMVTNPAYAFFGCLVMRLKMVPAEWCETAAVDGESLFYNPTWIESLTETQLLFVLCHEVWHLARFHHCRRNGRDLEEWNAATDLTINPDLVKLGLDAPPGLLFDAFLAGKGAEEIYRLRQGLKSPPAAPEPDEESDQDNGDGDDSGNGGDGDESGDGNGAASGAGDGGDGSGDGDGAGNDQTDASGDASGSGDGSGNGSARAAPDPGRCGGVIDAAPDQAGLKEAQAEMESAVRQAVSVARAANSGTLPEWLAPLVDELNAPRLSWRDQLQEFVDDAATRETDWNRPNKRFLGSGFILPGSVNASVRKGVVVIDESGSIGRKALAAFRDESQGILDDGRVETLVLVYCHAAVSGEQEFIAGDTVRIETRATGGTAFAPAFRHIAANHSDASFVIYLTDLEPGYGIDAWGPEPEIPVLWCVDGSKRSAPFGTVIPIDPYA